MDNLRMSRRSSRNYLGISYHEKVCGVCSLESKVNMPSFYNTSKGDH